MPKNFRIIINYYRARRVCEPPSPPPWAKWGVGSVGSSRWLDRGEISHCHVGEGACYYELPVPGCLTSTLMICAGFSPGTFVCLLPNAVEGKFDSQFVDVLQPLNLDVSQPSPEPA